ncbi:MAG: AlpA family phage regulatory protein [Aliishimia sp.]
MARGTTKTSLPNLFSSLESEPTVVAVESDEAPVGQIRRSTQPDPGAERFLNVKAVADRYSTHIATIWRWAKDVDDFPAPVKLGNGATRWRLSDLDAYEDRRSAIAVSSTANVQEL